MKSEDSSKHIGSEELEAGHAPCNSPAGQQLDLFGQPLSPASHSPRLGKGKAKPTSGTSGQSSFVSSRSVVLSASLANRLLALVDTNGSMEYVMTWKRRVMHSGLRIFRLHARARRTSDKGFSGWPTPDHAYHGSYQDPETALSRVRSKGKDKRQANLEDVAKLAVWATPTSRDWQNGLVSKETMNRNARPLNEQAVMLAGWVSPRSSETGRRRSPEAIAMAKKKGGSAALEDQVHLAGWRTPVASDHKGACQESETTSRKISNLPSQVLSLVSGTPSISSTASTERREGLVLNAEMSRWLMGYPRIWSAVAPTGVLRGRRERNSYEDTATP